MPIVFTVRDISAGTRGRDRLGERRQPDARRERRRLVLHVDDLRLPLAPRARDDLARLDHVQHVGVAIVVVADVLLIQLVAAAQPRTASRRSRDTSSTTMFWPSGLIDGHSIRTTLSRIGLIFGSSACDEQVVGELDRVLRAGDLGRVQAAADVDERLALARASRRASSSVRPSGWASRWAMVRYRSTLARFSALEIEREIEVIAVRGRTSFDERQPIARGVELPEICQPPRRRSRACNRRRA